MANEPRWDMALLAAFSLLLGPLSWAADEGDGAAPRKVRVLTVADAISPATSDYIRRGINTAHEDGVHLVVLRLDTPGGLDTAMRDIIRDIIASPVPVAIYVAPSGARAASAGTYMLYAAHVAAMAPGTNLGAATPVQIGGLPGIDPSAPEPPEVGDGEDKAENGDSERAKDASPATPGGENAMTRKLVNDAVAYIRSLAELRGRNVEWAEQAVREAASLSSKDALDRDVIDLIATDMDDLMRQLDGRAIEIAGQRMVLRTAKVELEMLEPDWRTELLAVIANPNVAYILMLLGVYGLFFELAHPGFLAPGIIGAICMLLALYSMQVLPVNYAGLGLLFLGIAFMVVELFTPSFGALGIGGIIAFIVGSVILFDSEAGHYRVSLAVIGAVATLTAAFFFIAGRAVLRSYRRPVVTGREQLLGSFGEALEDFESTGSVRVHSELWNARTSRPLRKGDRVKVLGVQGLILAVEPVEKHA
jgi:membrane-bound serine protease (ClpP class)